MYGSYFICTSPRSGSTLLCRMLKATGVAGAPNSFFHGETLDAWAKGLDVELHPDATRKAQIRRLFEAAKSKGRGGTALFGTRLQGHSFAAFRRELHHLNPDAANDAARVAADFGQTAFIHLTREDKLAQAVSYVKAQQTGLWHRRADGSELERLAPPKPPRFDAAAITRQIEAFETMDDTWRAWFRSNAITPLTIPYETLATAPQETLARVLDHIGCDPARASQINPDVAPLSDDTNADWMASFRSGHP